MCRQCQPTAGSIDGAGRLLGGTGADIARLTLYERADRRRAAIDAWEAWDAPLCLRSKAPASSGRSSFDAPGSLGPLSTVVPSVTDLELYGSLLVSGRGNQ